jgi:hypothetical protein
MGYFSELMIERQNDYVTDALAELWGVDYYELVKHEYELIEQQADDGSTTAFTIEFAPNVSEEFLHKIPGIKGHTVQVEHNVIIDAEPFEYEFAAMTEAGKLRENFEKEIANLRSLNELDLGTADLEMVLKRQIYVAAITMMETFLSETFVRTVIGDKAVLEKFVRSHPAFKERKFTLNEIYDKYHNIEDTAKKIMLETIYHDLVKVRLMYSTTLGIKFPVIVDAIQCVRVRHDLVHRNGKSNDGKIQTIDRAKVEAAIQVVEKLVTDLIETMELQALPF